MLRWRGLPIQLFVLTILPLTLLLVAIAFGSLFLHRRAMRDLVVQRDERAVRAAASAITEQLKHREAAIRGLALRAAGGSSVDHILSDAGFLLPDFAGGIALFDADLNLLAGSNIQPTWELALPQQLAGPVTPDGAVYTSPFTVDSAGEVMIAVVVATAEGVVVAGAFAPAQLAAEALNHIFTDQDRAAVFLADTEGRLLYQLGQTYDEATDARDVSGSIQGGSTTTYSTEAGEEYVTTTSSVPPLDWVLAFREPWQAVTDPLLRLTEWAPLVLVPVLIIALIGLLFGLRQIVQPLQSLEKQASRLGWGEFEAIETPVGGIHEIQRLQKELIHMAHKVKLAQQSLRGYLGAVTAGQEEERRRLARDLHDDTIQALIALNQRVQLAQLSAADPDTVAHLVEMQQMAEQAIADLRRLTRDLRPIYLEDLGLVTALQMLARDTSATVGIPVEMRVMGSEKRLSPEVELAFYRIAQEGLNNMARHARAKYAELRLAYEADRSRLTIWDNGRGFAVPDSPSEMASDGHFGLLGIQERAESIGASMMVQSTPGEGTQLTIILLHPLSVE